jgi:NADH-quinone oxidoreductase subunit J
MTPLLILAPLILLAAIGAVWMARPVHAALMLALTLALVAVLYLALGAEFIGLVQFAVYVGAVAVLIVFSLLITRHGDEEEEIKRRPRSLVTGLFCTLPVLLVLGYVSQYHTNIKPIPWHVELPIAKLGEILFTTHAPAVIALAVLLTAVLIGAALFAREPSTKPQPKIRNTTTDCTD